MTKIKTRCFVLDHTFACVKKCVHVWLFLTICAFTLARLRTPRECVHTTYPPTKLQIHPNKEKMGAEEGSGEGDGKDPKDEAVCLPFPAPPSLAATYD